VRVVNTRNEVGLFTVTSTAAAQGQIIVTNGIDVDLRLKRAVGDFQDIYSQLYIPVGGAVTLQTHLALATPHHDVEMKDVDSVLRRTFRGGPASIMWRWLVGRFNEFTLEFDFEEVGERGILCARPGYSVETDHNAEKTPMAFGTAMSPFFRPDAGVLQKFILQVAKLPGSEWEGPTHNRDLLPSDPFLFVRNSKSIEVLENF
jgi:hypothetical protein